MFGKKVAATEPNKPVGTGELQQGLDPMGKAQTVSI